MGNASTFEKETNQNIIYRKMYNHICISMREKLFEDTLTVFVFCLVLFLFFCQKHVLVCRASNDHEYMKPNHSHCTAQHTQRCWEECGRSSWWCFLPPLGCIGTSFSWWMARICPHRPQICRSQWAEYTLITTCSHLSHWKVQWITVQIHRQVDNHGLKAN